MFTTSYAMCSVRAMCRVPALCVVCRACVCAVCRVSRVACFQTFVDREHSNHFY